MLHDNPYHHMQRKLGYCKNDHAVLLTSLHRVGLESSSTVSSPPTSSLPKISPCSPESIGGWPLGYEERSELGLIGRAISFQDFQPVWSWSSDSPTTQTDRQTDDMRSQDCALHYSASCGKNWLR